MSPHLIFQLVASTMAVLFSGASLMFWLLNSEVLGQEERTKAIIYGQIIISATIILGSIASIPLAVQISHSKNGMYPPRPVYSTDMNLNHARSFGFHISYRNWRSTAFARYERGKCARQDEELY